MDSLDETERRQRVHDIRREVLEHVKLYRYLLYYYYYYYYYSDMMDRNTRSITGVRVSVIVLSPNGDQLLFCLC